MICDSIIKTSDVCPIPVFGPLMMKKFANPGTVVPRYARKPSAAHALANVRPLRVRMRSKIGLSVTRNPVAEDDGVDGVLASVGRDDRAFTDLGDPGCFHLDIALHESRIVVVREQQTLTAG
ncbi:hypothetical protein GCM10011571_35140 [Marinithermofilum abyssi]|uniref:Uncharacterized protein n=1 Tax=Marinithermofilum abyssi TaxID=1571185 RepID=A0A8J2YFI6_9BACL|nr:hypothetical protein GCM10011571_35140 [Marinithermofilum abyssi]